MNLASYGGDRRGPAVHPACVRIGNPRLKVGQRVGMERKFERSLPTWPDLQDRVGFRFVKDPKHVGQEEVVRRVGREARGEE